jgi:hypothetical protein
MPNRPRPGNLYKELKSLATRDISQDHKEALARGREQGLIVRRYLEALEVKKRPGRKRTPESIASQLDAIEKQLVKANPLARLQLNQKKKALNDTLKELKKNPQASMAQLEQDFIKVAYEYGKRKGISYSSWRQAGVPTQVLTKARIHRTRISKRNKNTDF